MRKKRQIKYLLFVHMGKVLTYENVSDLMIPAYLIFEYAMGNVNYANEFLDGRY